MASKTLIYHIDMPLSATLKKGFHGGSQMNSHYNDFFKNWFETISKIAPIRQWICRDPIIRIHAKENILCKKNNSYTHKHILSAWHYFRSDVMQLSSNTKQHIQFRCCFEKSLQMYFHYWLCSSIIRFTVQFLVNQT